MVLLLLTHAWMISAFTPVAGVSRPSSGQCFVLFGKLGCEHSANPAITNPSAFLWYPMYLSRAAQARPMAGDYADQRKAPARPRHRPAGASCARRVWRPPSARHAGRTGAAAAQLLFLRMARLTAAAWTARPHGLCSAHDLSSAGRTGVLVGAHSSWPSDGCSSGLARRCRGCSQARSKPLKGWCASPSMARAVEAPRHSARTAVAASRAASTACGACAETKCLLSSPAG